MGRTRPRSKVFQSLLSHALLIGVGLFFFIPFLWMLSTAFKSDQDVFRSPPSWLPHDNATVIVNGESVPLYNVTFKEDGSVRQLALLSIADGQGTFVDPNSPAETITSRMRYAEPILVPQLRWQNFPDALNRATRPGIGVTFWTYFGNSLFIAGWSIIGTLVSCTPVAYGFARIQWPGRDVLFVLVLATMMLPFQVTMIPLYVFFTDTLHWGNTFLPLIVPTFFGNGFDIFLLRQFFRTIPEELCDAGRVDGASEWQIFLRLVLPLSTPVLATISVFTFLYAWNDFTAPLLFLTSPQNYTMAIGLQDFQGQHTVAWNQLMAASVVFTIPIIIAFFFAQKTFIQGIKLTGLKE
ncbi:MAG: ABC transporter permease subunit [Chloroflexi bacterium]|nr:ABC transporter permease subunit [Chloroflexota bacterium]